MVELSGSLVPWQRYNNPQLIADNCWLSFALWGMNHFFLGGQAYIWPDGLTVELTDAQVDSVGGIKNKMGKGE